jgi:hypothetical protein
VLCMAVELYCDSVADANSASVADALIKGISKKIELDLAVEMGYWDFRRRQVRFLNSNSGNAWA